MSLSGKNLVLTGCTAGIGEGIAMQLVPLGLKNFILVNRNKQKTENLISMLKEVSGCNVQRFHSVIADCGEPDQMDRAVKEIALILEDKQNDAGGVLHIFINNAGIWQADKSYKEKSPLKNSKNQEAHFATNYLSMVILAKGLRPMLEAATEKSNGTTPGRILITGSFTSWELVKGELDVKNLSGEKHTSGKMPVCNDITYGQSKLCQHMWARSFARETSELKHQNPLKKIHVIVYCPGAVESSIDVVEATKKAIPKCLQCFLPKFRVPAQAATIPVYLCEQEAKVFSQIESFHGEAGLYCDCGKAGQPKLEKIMPPAGAVTDQNMKKVFLCKLETYPTYGRKIAPSTKDWAKVEELVDYTEKALNQ